MTRSFTHVFSVVAIGLSSVAWASAQSTALPACLPEDQLPGLKNLLVTAVTQAPTSLTNSIEIARLEANKMVDESAMWPSLNANVSYSGVQSSIAGSSDSKSKNSGFFYNLSLYQPIYHWGALKAQADIGELYAQIGQHRYEEGYRLLALSIRAQYLDLIQKKKAVTFSDKATKNLEEQVKALEQRLAAGAISQAELSEPRLRLAEARITGERLSDAFDTSCRALAALCGVESISADSISDDYPKPSLTTEQLQQVLAAGDRFNPLDTPQGRIYDINLRQNDLQYKVARTRNLPKFNLSASASESTSTDATGGRINSYNVSQQMVGVSGYWMIFDGFATRGTKMALRQQRRQQELILSDYEKVQKEKVAALRRQIQLASRALEIAETRYDIARAAVTVIADDIKSGHSSEEGLKIVNQNARASELTTLATRAELFAKIAEYLSIVGADPVVANLQYRNRSHGE